ncbi:MAG: Fe-S cluster assembly protein SufB, partial [Candidatus Zixiibacteriota bacterium]
ISLKKNEPKWMLEKRLAGLVEFEKLQLSKWGANLSGIKWRDLVYYVEPRVRDKVSWEDLPDDLKKTFDALGVPEAEKKWLAGVEMQVDSEKMYSSLKKHWEKLGVVFLSMDEGLKQYPEIVREYFGSIIPVGSNKLSALNVAVWSGGSFVYVPKGVEVKLPLQAYFYMETERMGQFERTLIVVEEGAQVHYIEGCSAVVFGSPSLHAGVVEVVVKKNAKCRYTTVQNWYKNVYNLVTKRADVGERARMEWVDANIGSRVTMKYPACLLKGEGASGSMLSIAVAGGGQQLDTGAKMYHLAPNTTSEIISKSISKDGGRSSYRGLVSIAPNAKGSKSRVVCDALILDSESRSDTYPMNRVMTQDAQLEHEAYASKISEEKTQYLMSRGMTEGEAHTMIVRGFLGEVMDELPMEYAVELNRLVKMEMEGSVG